MIKKIPRSVIIVLTFVFCGIILALCLRGIAGNPTSKDLNSLKWKDEGPLELSPDRGRFALTYSLLEDHSYQFSLAVARFADPDVAMAHNHFVSLFAPTVSYIIMPGYLLGKLVGLSQVGSFAIISLFAILNVILLRAVAIRLGASPLAAMLAALLFLFATPAFPYAVSLYQHHISTFLILLSLYTLLRWKNVWSLGIIWFLCGLSISVDNPNLFFMFPIGVFALGRLVSFESVTQKTVIRVKYWGFLTLVVMALPIAFFLYFNKMSYGDPFQLAGTVASATHSSLLQADKKDLADTLSDAQTATLAAEIATSSTQVASAAAILTPPAKQKNALHFFQTRQLPNGFYEHFVSLDRGMIVYTPIMFLGVFGILVLRKRNKSMMQLLLAVLGTNVLLYSMWGDPYGGWAFGSRYLIPTYAILALFLSLALTRFRRNAFFLGAVLILGIYAVCVNTFGALTSNRNPPKAEVLALEALTGRRERYTFTRNMDVLDHNTTKSFLYYFTPAHELLTPWQYADGIIVAISSVILLYTIALFITRIDTQK